MATPSRSPSRPTPRARDRDRPDPTPRHRRPDPTRRAPARRPPVGTSSRGGPVRARRQPRSRRFRPPLARSRGLGRDRRRKQLHDAAAVHAPSRGPAPPIGLDCVALQRRRDGQWRPVRYHHVFFGVAPAVLFSLPLIRAGVCCRRSGRRHSRRTIALRERRRRSSSGGNACCSSIPSVRSRHGEMTASAGQRRGRR
jgi:hypothetical protein